MFSEDFTPTSMQNAISIRVKCVIENWKGETLDTYECMIDNYEPEFEIIKRALIEAAEKLEQRRIREEKKKEKEEYELYLKLKKKFESNNDDNR